LKYEGSPSLHGFSVALQTKIRLRRAVTVPALLTMACATLVLAAAAQAQDALKLCQKIQEDAERLKCYDGVAASPSNAPVREPQSKPGAEGTWEIRDEKSPLDDSPLVSASLTSADGKAYLLMRCKDRKTEVGVNKFGFIKCGAGVRVIYRIDQGQAVETPWNSHPSCYLALSPSPIPFIRSLTDQGKVYFRMWDHHDAPHDALFNVGKISELRSRLAEACNWEGGAAGTPEPAPNPPAAAASPRAPQARPR
jgi:Type VI secretion system VasI, EvfG, VC_A0118